MTRSRPAEAPDLHDRFGQWLQAGAPGEPARDVAVHAAHCPACRALVAAWDRLAMVDTGRAPMPPSRTLVAATGGGRLGWRAAAAAAAGILVIAIGAWVGASALRPPDVGQAPGSPPPDQDVLGGFGAGGSAAPSVSGDVGLDDSQSPWASSSATAEPATATPAATHDGPAPAPTASPRPVIPAPTARPTAGTQAPNPTQTIAPTQPPTAAPTTTPPAPTPTPSPVPTFTPTPVPTPEPSPTAFGDCQDGIDNDGDLLIDIADPGCLLDENEFSA